MKNLEPEEFEAGENVTDQVVRRHTSSGIVISVRLSPEDSAKLIELAEETGKTVSQVARQAIRSFVSRRGQHPVFVPEITGATAHVSIVTVGPLGPRTAHEGVRIEDVRVPRTSQTGALAGAT